MLALGLIGLNDADIGYDIIVRPVWLHIKFNMRPDFYGSRQPASILMWHFDSITDKYILFIVIHWFKYSFGDLSSSQGSFCWKQMLPRNGSFGMNKLEDNRLPLTGTQPKM